MKEYDVNVTTVCCPHVKQIFKEDSNNNLVFNRTIITLEIKNHCQKS